MARYLEHISLRRWEATGGMLSIQPRFIESAEKFYNIFFLKFTKALELIILSLRD